MEHTVTFHNGNTMPTVGLGTFRCKDGEELVNAVRHAIVSGYRSIDTAKIYDNETSVGEGIRQGIEAAGITRADLFITSKIWLTDYGYESAKEAYKTSLKKLGLDYLDLYLIHWPGTEPEKYIETWKALEELYNEGKVRNIGVSNFKEEHLEELLQSASVKPVINQVEFHPHLLQEGLREYLEEKHIVGESWSPLMNGAILDNEVIKEIAEKHGKTPAQIIIRFNMDNNVVVIPKSVTPSRIEENIQVFDFTLDAEDMKKIKALNKDERIGPDPSEYAGK